MINEEILKKAIEKAIFSGRYNFPFFDHESSNDVKAPWSIPMAWLMDRNRYFQIIFEHDFAKAFFGELKRGGCSKECQENGMAQYLGHIDYCPGKQIVNEGWQYHLQQMVLEENPLEYLAKFLKGK